MNVKVRRAALIAAAVATVAGCAPAAIAAQISADPSWHIVKRVDYNGSNGVFTAVAAVGRNGGWAFDGYSNAAAWERNGSTWTQVPFPSQHQRDGRRGRRELGHQRLGVYPGVRPIPGAALERPALDGDAILLPRDRRRRGAQPL